MGLFSKKKKITYGSFTTPLFSFTDRINNYEGLQLDYQSDYNDQDARNYSRDIYEDSSVFPLIHLKRYADQHGFTAQFGSLSSTVFTDASADLTVVQNQIKSKVPNPHNGTVKIYTAPINYFSPDFWARHLVSQAGYGNLVTNPDDVTDITSDQDNMIVTISTGQIFTGAYPVYTNERSICAEYTITYTQTKTETYTDDDGSTVTETDTVTSTDYGYYCYVYGTGNSTLDWVINNQNHITRETDSFLPFIPIRLGDAKGKHSDWISDPSKINQLLTYLGMYDKTDSATPYDQIKNQIVDSLSDSDVKAKDLDRASVFFALPINAYVSSDCKYLYKFFENAYVNTQIAAGRPQADIKYKPLNQAKKLFEGVMLENVTSAEPPASNTFSITNSTSNINFVYSWNSAELFEKQGKFKSNASIGEYGILAGVYSYDVPRTEWQTITYKNYKKAIKRGEDPANFRFVEEYSYTEEVYVGGEDEWVYKTITVPEHYEQLTTWYEKVENGASLILFCFQESSSHFKIVAFSDLVFRNYIYSGKNSVAYAFDDLYDQSGLGLQILDFSADSPNVPHDGQSVYWESDTKSILSFKVGGIKRSNNSLNPEATNFIVPLEKNALLETGVRDVWEFSNSCMFLVCNWWDIKKVSRWKSFLSKLIYYGLMIGVIRREMNFLRKVFGSIFGKVGELIVKYAYMAVAKIIQVLAIVFRFFGITIWISAILVVIYTALQGAINMEYYGMSREDAMLSAAIQGLVTGAAVAGAGALGSATGAVQATSLSTLGTAYNLSSNFALGALGGLVGFSTSLGSGLASLATGSGVSLGKVFGQAILSGAMSFGASYIGAMFRPESAAAQQVAQGVTQSATQVGTQTATQTFSDIALKMAEKFAKDTLSSPGTYLQIINTVQSEAAANKMMNIASDYESFNNKAKSAQEVLDLLLVQQTSMYTAQQIAKQQLAIGRMSSIFPETMQNISADTWLTQATMSATEQTKMVLGGANLFVSSKLTMEGFTPYNLHYSTYDYSLAWDLM